MTEHDAGDELHEHESELLHAQEHKGYGDDEGERDEELAELEDHDDPEAD
jgi:hypothetical protein